MAPNPIILPYHLGNSVHQRVKGNIINVPVRFHVEEEVLILWSGVFRTMRSWHTQHHSHWTDAQQHTHQHMAMVESSLRPGCAARGVYLLIKITTEQNLVRIDRCRA